MNAGTGGGGGVAVSSPAALTASSEVTATIPAVPRQAPAAFTVVKSDLDTREYRFVRMDNGLEVRPSGGGSATAAACMSIKAGHMQDPWPLAGLAHFHEHCVFLGTEKFSEEGEYERYLTEHGGSSNAYTAVEDTAYFFDVSADHLEGALDRFAQFFQCPLFSPSAIERELRAVDSEHANNRQDDTWRLFQVLKSTADPRHPFSNFGSGDQSTLEPRSGVDTRRELIRFHERRVSPITGVLLSVLGKESLDELEAMVRRHFSGVRSGAPGEVAAAAAGLPGTLSAAAARLWVVPLREARKLILQWPLPPRSTTRRARPELYIAHLLGHESEGSLHALLTARGWATGLTAGSQV
ncbi:unnamed protein product, partial [Phaeothamnion confervicola]